MGRKKDAITLMPFQRKGQRFLRDRKRAYLADEFGLGKTVQALSAARFVTTEMRKNPIVVICPAALRGVWRQAAVDLGWEERKRRALHVLSYEELRPDVNKHGIPVKVNLSARAGRKMGEVDLSHPHVCILDEAHYVKNQHSRRAKAALTIARNAEYAWLLSGTPMPNGDPNELYAPLSALWPNVLRKFGTTSSQKFREYFTTYRESKYGLKTTGLRDAHVKELNIELKRFVLRRTWTQVELDLPPIRFTNTPIPVADPKRIREMMQPDAVEIAIAIREHRAPQLPAGALSKIRHELGRQKADAVGPMIRDELTRGEYNKVVVLAYHLDALDTLQQELMRFGLVRVDGSTPDEERADEVARFQENDGARVFLGQITTAGHGLTLTAAREILILEPAWTPGINFNAAKRIHRIGQEHPCRVRFITAEGTLDEKLGAALASKASRYHQLHGDLEDATDDHSHG